MSDLSSYIELFAAVYLTISLDDMLLKRFWTPDYEKEMEQAFKRINLPDVAKGKAFARASSLSSIEESRSRKRGVIMFSLSVLLLIFIGLEDCIPFLKNETGYICVLILTFLYSVVFLLDELFLKTGSRVFVVAFCTPVVCSLLIYALVSDARLELMLQSGLSINWELVSKCFVIIALLMPVLWQLFRNWLYTRFYLLYIVEQTAMKAKDYNYAINYNQKKGDKMSLVAKPYADFVAETIAQGDQDRQITPFMNTLMDELESVDYLPVLSSLIYQSYLMHRKHYPSVARLKKLSKQYDALRKKVPLEEFCKKHNVEDYRLREYRNRQQQ